MTVRGGLPSLLTAFGTAGALTAVTYAFPGLEAYRPWVPGDPLPVVSALLPRTAPRVVEDARGELVEAPAAVPVAAEADDAPAGTAARSAGSMDAGAVGTAPAAEQSFGGQEVAVRPNDPDGPGVPTALVDAGHRGMDRFYRALARTEAGSGLARASHWGDSTIAADGITATVRARMQRRFGDGGPGYLSAGMDPRWNIRRDVSVSRKGDWETKSLLLGGATGARFGFGGIVSSALADASLTISSPKRGGERVAQHRFEVWWQSAPESGSWWATVDGRGAGGGSAASEGQADRWLAVDVPEGYTRGAIGATGGPATFYGVVMETRGPGVVWDALGVVGVGSRSFTANGRKHLATQIARRAPDLVVIQLGGNELGLPALSKGNGEEYRPTFTDVVRRLRAGAPEAGCLIVTPLDQGTREGGTPRTKPNLPRLVAQQRAVAEAEGCAFWDAYAAMGGEGSMVAWTQMKPPLAWTDLLHVSGAGQEIIGNLLADAIEAGFTQWKADGGTGRAPTPPLGVAPVVDPGAVTNGSAAGGAAPVAVPAAPAAPAAQPDAPAAEGALPAPGTTGSASPEPGAAPAP